MQGIQQKEIQCQTHTHTPPLTQLKNAKHKEIEVVLNAIRHETSKSLDDIDDNEDEGRRNMLLNFLEDTERRVQQITKPKVKVSTSTKSATKSFFFFELG